jgi:hypothetical protein
MLARQQAQLPLSGHARQERKKERQIPNASIPFARSGKYVFLPYLLFLSHKPRLHGREESLMLFAE